jgi:HPt (histidine-containing phosphotransfer) domain-containing protein
VPNDRVEGIAGSVPSVGSAYGSEPIRSSLVGDPRMMQIIPGFVLQLADKVRKMLDLLEHHDLVALQLIVHEIAGAAGGYGFASVTQSARRAEQSIKAGDALGLIAVEIHSLVEVIRQIEGYDESQALVGARPGSSEKSN